jgi:hypothetical protein
MVTQSDKTSTGVVATIVVVGAFSMVSISVLLTALVRSEEAEVDAVRPMYADLDTIAALDRQQADALHAAPHWVDQKSGKLGIPIERAKQLVIQDLRQDPSAASPPIPPGLVLPPVPPPEGSVSGAPVPGAAPGTATPGAPAAVPGGLPPAPAAPAPASPAGSLPAVPAPTSPAPLAPALGSGKP